MKITMLSASDAIGGAARAAQRLHAGLMKAGQDAQLLVMRRSGSGRNVRQHQPAEGFLARKLTFWRNRIASRQFHRYDLTRPPGYELFTSARGVDGYSLLEDALPADVINLHWAAMYLDYGTFLPAAARRVPIAWTLHDMNPMTGGCHYDHECGRFQTGCGSCPQLGSSDDTDLSARIWRGKKKVFDALPDHALHFVTLNSWMDSEVARSPLLGRFPRSLIPNGLDMDIFTPHDRNEVRRSLDISTDAKIVLFVSDSINDRRKGLAYLHEALRALSHVKGICLVSIGEGSPPPVEGVAHRSMGRIEDEVALARVYCAADIFVIPSLQDNLPNTVLEAMACGVPVAGFDVGGIPAMVRPGETGLLAPVRDVDALRVAIATLLENDELRRAMAARCRRVAVKEFSLECQSSAYTRLFESMSERFQQS
jgi:glycosyltransferase involved in cell wall biosynthesis